MLKFLKRLGIILLSIIILLGIIVALYLQHPMFGARPSGDRLIKIQQSPNYHDGQFWNLSDTPMITPADSQEEEVSGFSWLMTDDSKRLAPKVDIPSVKTDLKSLNKNENIVVWLGHSAYFMILDGKTYLVDPTLISGSPVWFVNKPFKGTSVYSLEDIPEIDYLIITHDHYDHLDYFTMKKLKDKVGKVITSLGVGAHLEKWGFEQDDINEMDRYDESDLNQNIKITCLPARHYSGRLWQNNTLWSSFMLETENKTVYIGGDSGYDKFFQEIGQKRNDIDLAVIENGQYDEQRRYIHLLPDDVVQVIKDLNPKKVLTVHNSKYSMANHARDEPMILLDEKLQEEGLIDNFGRGIWLTPMIGDVVDLDKNQTFPHWWVDLENKDYSGDEEVYGGGNELIEESVIDNGKETEVDMYENISPEPILVKGDSNIQYYEDVVSGDVVESIEDEQIVGNEEILSNTQDTMDNINTINLTIGNKTFQLKLVKNSATEEFVEKLKEGNIVIKTHDYGGFEKVGELGFSLPREDSQITTNPGDIVLYQGNQFSLFYESNSWSYTKIGTIQNISQSELKNILGEGDVELIFSIN